VANTERDTNLIFRTLHNTARVAKNSVSDEVVAVGERPGAKFEDVRELVAGSRGALVYETGDTEAGVWWAGLTQGLIHDIPSVGELVERIMTEAEQLISSRLTGLVSGDPSTPAR
jgi:nitronate monooxygenase